MGLQKQFLTNNIISIFNKDYLGCTPRYWITVDGNEDHLGLCNATQLAKIDGLYDMLNDETKTYSGGMKKFQQELSCDRMSAISLTDKFMDNSGGRNLTIKIRYVAQSYQEVTLIIFGLIINYYK